MKPSNRIIAAFDFEIPELGVFRVVPLRRSHNITLRRHGAGMRVSVPYGISVESLVNTLKTLVPRLEARTAADSVPKFHLGQSIILPEITVDIVAASDSQRGVKVRREANVVTVSVAPTLDIMAPEVVQTVNRLIIKGVTWHADAVLLPRAMALASEAGVVVTGWKTGSGRRTLGTCSASGVITLSAMLMFLPQHLRDYVVWHELAHRTHMNHSAGFHALCDRYCGGRERQLRRELRLFSWPVLR